MRKKTPKRELLTDLTEAERLSTLKRHIPDVKSLDDELLCLHCDQMFKLRDARIYADPEFSKVGGRAVECATPGCDGSPLEFAKRPWWRVVSEV